MCLFQEQAHCKFLNNFIKERGEMKQLKNKGLKLLHLQEVHKYRSRLVNALLGGTAPAG